MNLAVAVPAVAGNRSDAYCNENNDAKTNLEDALSRLGWLGMSERGLWCRACSPAFRRGLRRAKDPAVGRTVGASRRLTRIPWGNRSSRRGGHIGHETVRVVGAVSALPSPPTVQAVTLGSLGRPSTRSPTILRWICEVPPQMVSDRLKKNEDWSALAG